MSGATPRALGFRMPAEWEPHEATWIAWPHNKEDWPGRFAPIPWVYCEIVRKLSRVEKVRILVNDAETILRATRMLLKAGANLDAVEFFEVPTDRVWTRDYAPLFVKSSNGELAITNWIFNAWAKYDDWHLDNAVNGALSAQLRLRCWEPRLVLEGGSIDVNGAGTLMTTEECLLSPIQARNPHLTRDDIEAAMSAYLGIDRVIWLKAGIAGDDTHGHIDDLARFVNTGTVVIAQESNRQDANYEPLKENRTFLEREGVEAVSLPMPAPVYFEGPTIAGELRELLHRQSVRPGAYVQRPQRPTCAQRVVRTISGPRHNRHSLGRTGLGSGNAPLHDPTTTSVKAR